VLAAPPEIDVYTACYDLLARLYLDGPSALRTQQLPPVSPLLDALGQIDRGWPARVDALLAHHERAALLERAHREYLHAFVLPVPGSYVPPYASVYLDDGTLWGDSTFKILRLYATEGLSWQRANPRPAGGAASVTAPDHVGIEFAFLVLATSRPRRGPAEAKRQQRLAWFLGDHIGRWLPAYRDALVEAGAGPSLGGWTNWACDVIDSDLRRRVPTERETPRPKA
jgi:TorA maturation chaperone TorD